MKKLFSQNLLFSRKIKSTFLSKKLILERIFLLNILLIKGIINSFALEKTSVSGLNSK